MASSLTLDIGEDRLLLQTRSNTYLLDIYFPYNVIQEDCGAQFDRKSKVNAIEFLNNILLQHFDCGFIM